MHTTAEALDRLLDPLSQAFTPEVARKIVELRADPKVQRLLDDYADRNTEGELTPRSSRTRGIGFRHRYDLDPPGESS